MLKTAFVFPGQGAQYIGMAKDFYDTIPECKEVFQKATKLLGFDMAELCFVENDQLNKTEYTQAALVTACCSILKAVEQKGIKPDFTAGLSLGEYSALVANKTFTFEQAVVLVRKRGIFMENEVPDGVGAMAAVLGMETERIEKICKQVETETKNIVQLANYNCPGQVVISGEKSAVTLASERLKEAGARRVLELKVSGPFHSSMLKGAGEKLEKELEGYELHEMEVPYICNVTADIITDITKVKELLKQQVSSSVRLQQSIERMIAEGVDTFIEIGPGKTIAGFIKKIDRSKTIINIEKIEDLEKLG